MEGSEAEGAASNDSASSEMPFVCFCGAIEPELTGFLAHLCRAHRLLHPHPRDVAAFRAFIEAHRERAAELLATGDNPSKTAFRNAALEEALAGITEERERLRSTFNQRCLFCQDVIQGVDPFFEHMYVTHGFNCGSTDNLVSIPQLLESIQRRLSSFECLNCDKRFEDPVTLRTHMRKKKHFRCPDIHTPINMISLQ